MKDTIRKIFFDYNIPLTTNLKNDILLKKIIARELNASDNAIDIGCHKGEILQVFLKYAPKGTHFAIEPLPYFYEKLKSKFPTVRIFPYALSDKNGQAEFYWIKNDPAFSGFKKRKFSEQSADIHTIQVEVKKLDDIIPENVNIKFIKIDVEGAEMNVLKGAEKIIENHHPVIAFEFGLGGSDYYQTTPADLFNWLKEHQYQIYSFENYLQNKSPYTLQEFENVYKENVIYNFVAK
ncbi:MAG: hypothetical protein Fur0023_12620 [Bacteroidia bacterium]